MLFQFIYCSTNNKNNMKTKLALLTLHYLHLQ